MTANPSAGAQAAAAATEAFDAKMATMKAEHEAKMAEYDARHIETMVKWVNFWNELADDIERDTTIADRNVLADEMRERAQVVRQGEIDRERSA